MVAERFRSGGPLWLPWLLVHLMSRHGMAMQQPLRALWLAASGFAKPWRSRSRSRRHHECGNVWQVLPSQWFAIWTLTNTRMPEGLIGCWRCWGSHHFKVCQCQIPLLDWSLGTACVAMIERRSQNCWWERKTFSYNYNSPYSVQGPTGWCRWAWPEVVQGSFCRRIHHLPHHSHLLVEQPRDSRGPNDVKKPKHRNRSLGVQQQISLKTKCEGTGCSKQLVWATRNDNMCWLRLAIQHISNKSDWHSGHCSLMISQDSNDPDIWHRKSGGMKANGKTSIGIPSHMATFTGTMAMRIPMNTGMTSGNIRKPTLRTMAGKNQLSGPMILKVPWFPTMSPKIQRSDSLLKLTTWHQKQTGRFNKQETQSSVFDSPVDTTVRNLQAERAWRRVFQPPKEDHLHRDLKRDLRKMDASYVVSQVMATCHAPIVFRRVLEKDSWKDLPKDSRAPEKERAKVSRKERAKANPSTMWNTLTGNMGPMFKL